MGIKLLPIKANGDIPRWTPIRQLCITLAASVVLAVSAATPNAAPKTETDIASPGWFQGDFETHPAWIFTPPSTMPNGKHALMVVLHGCNQTFQQLKEYGNLENAATKRGIVLVIPDVGNKYWGSETQRCWDYDMAQDRSHHMNDLVKLVETLAATDGRNNIDRNHIYVVGLSAGGAMALDVSCKRPDLFAGVGSMAGPSVGSPQSMATWGPIKLPGVNDPQKWPMPLPLDNVANAEKTCKELASTSAISSNFDTQIANIAVGEMDRDSPQHKDIYPFQPPIDQFECDHAGQIAVVSQKWSFDNVEVLRKIYNAGELTAGETVQDGLAVNQTAQKDGKTRVSFLTIKSVGHAWPSGNIQAACSANNDPKLQSAGVWIAHSGLDYPEFITNWLMTNNLRGGNPFTSRSAQQGDQKVH